MRRVAVLCLGWALAFPSLAEEVGRTKFELPYPQWLLLTTFETKTVFSGGATAGSSLAVSNKVFYFADDAGNVRALLAIASQDSRYGLILWTGANCPASKSNYFTRDFGSNQHGRTLECLIVWTRFSPSAYFKPDSPVGKAVMEKKLKLPASGYYLRNHYGSDSGAQVVVTLITQDDFKGLPGVRPSTEETYGVPAEVVAWSEAMQKEVKSSVHSFRGKLAFPSIEFTK
jgi:hypothetical protein